MLHNLAKIMLKNLLPHTLLHACFFLLGAGRLYAQNDTMPDLMKFKVEDMYNLLSEDVLNVKVTIASKKSERLFDAPLSTSVVTKDDILRAGCTSIMEALRLMQGLLVFEQSNGNYDIHLRGGSNVQRNSLFSVAGNTTTLVMIDNRPTYNYYLGGTFWETLPIDLNDVERIELVRGATSAMYGPNAVSGVINIITRRAEQKGWHAVANAQQGSYQTLINNGALGYRFNDKFNFILSGNAQRRNRTQNTYYNYIADDYIAIDTILKKYTLGNAYPSPEQAMQKYGYNAFLNYTPNENIKLRASFGAQDSRVQKAYSENFATPLTTSTSKSIYADLNFQYKRLNTQISYQTGTQEEGLGLLGQKWDFTTLDGLLTYDFRINDASIELGVNFRQGIYDDTPYVDVVAKTGQFNGKRDIGTIAPFLRFDYAGFLAGKLRIASAIRLDKFNFPNKPYLSYNISGSYKIDERNIVRLVYARANRSANIIFTYADRFLDVTQNPLFPTAIEVAGNKQLNLLTTDMFEAGYRSVLKDNLQLNVEVFYNRTKNYANFLYGDAYNATVNSKSYTIQPFATYNIPLTTRQFGATVALNWLIDRLNVRPYITYQSMQLKSSSPYNNTAKAVFATNPTENNINTFLGKKESDAGMPTVFGGVILNYEAIPRKLYLNLNSYFFTSYKYYSYQNLDPRFADKQGVAKIASKEIINLKVNFQIVPNTSLFINARNILNQKTAEFFNTDVAGIHFFGGLHFEL